MFQQARKCGLAASSRLTGMHLWLAQHSHTPVVLSLRPEIWWWLAEMGTTGRCCVFRIELSWKRYRKRIALEGHREGELVSTQTGVGIGCGCLVRDPSKTINCGELIESWLVGARFTRCACET